MSSRNLVTGSSDYTVGASISFDIFNPSRGSRLAAARAAPAPAAAERDQLANQVRLEVVRSLQQFRVAQRQLDVAKSSVIQATEARRIIQDRYDEGLTTTTELLRAQTKLLRTQMELLAARQDYFVGYAALLLATGELNDVRLLS